MFGDASGDEGAIQSRVEGLASLALAHGVEGQDDEALGGEVGGDALSGGFALVPMAEGEEHGRMFAGGLRQVQICGDPVPG